MKEQILAVQRMQDYIESHLCENITLADLAGESLFSPWHSYRLFKEYTDLTPAEYIRRLRLSKSALRLRDEECKIIDVAFELGFGSADGYYQGVLPGVWVYAEGIREFAETALAVYPLWRKIQESKKG